MLKFDCYAGIIDYGVTLRVATIKLMRDAIKKKMWCLIGEQVPSLAAS